jgi:Exo-beta-D-glucosaminidase Ig-fold domain
MRRLGWSALVAIALWCALSGVAAARTRTLGLHGWQVHSSATATQPGAEISSSGFSTAGWLRVRPDEAGAPDSAINALLENGACPDVFFSTRMKDCFGYTDQWVAIGQFAVPWWYRTDFRAPRRRHAESSTAWSAPATCAERRPRNSLAIEVQPNDPNKMFTLDDVDWNQIPADNHMGNPQATMTQYADLSQLQHLAPARIADSAASHRDGDRTVTRVTIRNTSSAPTVGFLLRADVRRAEPGDNEVLPIAWSDNDITLWPGESQTLTATYSTRELHGRRPVVSVYGWNAPTIEPGTE